MSGRRLKFDLGEISGGFGDLGTFIPLAVSMVAVCGMDAGSVLVFAGLMSVIAGVAFGLPMPIQPMKAIAAVAIAEALAPAEIAAAGFVMGATVFLLGVSGVIGWVDRSVPRPVVRGIQLGVGIKLAAKGVGMIWALDLWGPDSILVASCGAVLVLLTVNWRRFPVALVLLVAGFVLLALDQPDVFRATSLGWAGPAWVWPSNEQWMTGTLRGALPQLPLTLLNSVIAVCALSKDLFPDRPIGVRPMAVSVGSMNLVVSLLGGLPCCHGSGGLAAQYRFGARTGGSVVFLGAVTMLVGVAFGSAAMDALAAFPKAVLGVLLAFAGLELALAARDAHERDPFFIAVATAAGILAVNAAVGFAVGLGVAFLLARTRSV